MTEKQVKYVRDLLSREGISFMEKDLALQYSNGATADLRGLTHEQTANLIDSIKEKTPKEKMQGKILSMAHELRWELANGKVNMERLNQWLIKYTPHKKTFNMLTEDELPMVVSVFERMYKGYLKSF